MAALALDEYARRDERIPSVGFPEVRDKEHPLSDGTHSRGRILSWLKSPRGRAFSAAVLVLVTTVGVVLGVRISRHVAQVDAGMRAAEEAIAGATSLNSRDLDELERVVVEGRRALRALRAETAPATWVSPVLGFLPWYGGTLRDSREILDYGLHLVSGASLTLEGLKPAADVVRADQPLLELLPEIGDALAESRTLFEEADREVELARTVRAGIRGERLTGGVRARLERGDALALRLGSLTGLGLQGPGLSANLTQMSGQAGALVRLLESIKERGVDQTTLHELTTTLEQLEGNLQRLVEQSPHLSALAPYLGLTPEEVDGGIAQTLDFLSAARLTMEALGPAAAGLVDDMMSLGALSEELGTAQARLEEASLLLRDADGLVAQGPLFEKLFPSGHDEGNGLGLTQYADLLQKAIQAGLQMPAMFQTAMELQAESFVLRDLLDGLADDDGGPDLEALERTGGNAASLLSRLQDEMGQLSAGLQFLGMSGDVVLADLDFYRRFLKAATLVAGGLRPLDNLLNADVAVNDPYGAIEGALKTGEAAFDEAQVLIDQMLEQQPAHSPTPLLAPYMPSARDLDRGLSVLRSAALLRSQLWGLMGAIAAADDDYQTLAGVFSATLMDPVSMALGDLQAYREDVQRGKSNLTEARDLWLGIRATLDASGLTLGLDDVLAGLGTPLDAAEAGFRAASGALDAAETLRVLSEEAVFSQDFADRLSLALPRASMQMRAARDIVRLEIAALEQSQANASRSFVGGATAELAYRLEQLAAYLTRGDAYLQAVGTLLGLEGPTVLLVLGQNDQEIRATGGFIGTVHEVVVDRGRMSIRRFFNSYDVDPSHAGAPLGPGAFCKYWIGTSCLQTFRDSNWWPDFPTSAELALDLYSQSRGTLADGVIGVDSWLMSGIVDALGGVSIPGLEGPIDGAAARAYAPGRASEYPCGPHNTTDVSNRCFAEDLFTALLQGVAERPDATPSLMELLFHSLAEKHMLVYLREEGAASLVSDLNWDGHMLDAPGDYLMVVDSSIYSEIHDRVERSVDYRVVLGSEGRAGAKLTVSYTNTGTTGQDCVQFWRQACYWNYFRIYTPVDIIVTSSPELPLPDGSTYAANAVLYGYEADTGDTFSLSEYGDQNKAQLAGLIAPRSHQTVELTFEYQLPANAVVRTSDGTWRYTLVVQKQPGTQGDLVNLTIQLPDDATLVATSIAPTSSNGPTLAFQFRLETDAELSVEYTKKQ